MASLGTWATRRESDGIGAPDDGGEERRGVAAEIGRIEAEAVAAGDDEDGAGEGEDAADDVLPFEPLAGQERREHHDQQRPEVVDEAGLDRPARGAGR